MRAVNLHRQQQQQRKFAKKANNELYFNFKLISVIIYSLSFCVSLWMCVCLMHINLEICKIVCAFLAIIFVLF